MKSEGNINKKNPKNLPIHWCPFLSWAKKYAGKSMSKALIFAPTNPKYDNRLFIELRVQYMKTTSSEHVYINCSECQNKKQFLYTVCSPRVLPMFWAWNFHVINWLFNEQSVVIFWFSWCNNKSLWLRFNCTYASTQVPEC